MLGDFLSHYLVNFIYLEGEHCHDTWMESDDFPHSAVGILGLELRLSGLAPSPLTG